MKKNTPHVPAWRRTSGRSQYHSPGPVQDTIEHRGGSRAPIGIPRSIEKIKTERPVAIVHPVPPAPPPPNPHV